MVAPNTAALAGPWLTCLVAVGVGLAVPSASADQFIGPGQESHVLALFAPARLGDEVIPGYRLANVAIHPREVEVSLAVASSNEDPAATVVVTLRSREAPVDRGKVALAESPSFALIVTQEDAAARGPALLPLADRVRQNDDGNFWTEIAVVQAASAVPEEAAGFDVLAGYVASAAAIAVLLLLARSGVRRLRRR